MCGWFALCWLWSKKIGPALEIPSDWPEKAQSAVVNARLLSGFLLVILLFSCQADCSRRDEIEKLQSENEMLYAENSDLEDNLGKRAFYWQSSKSGVIHNSDCRWYGKSNGKYVDSSADGRNCENCGGINE